MSENFKKLSKMFSWVEISLNFGKMAFQSTVLERPLDKAQKFLSDASKALNDVSDSLKKDFHHIKNDIKDALNEQQDKILVIIDDLDRLTHEEARELLKVVKAVCDLPKIIFLIACDQEKIAHALKSFGESEDLRYGHDYLEKIVQASLNVPLADASRLWELFLEQTKKFFEEQAKNKYLYNQDDVENIIYDISPRLKTPRHVNRLINALMITYPSVRDNVYISDFLGIQTLRVFYPSEYSVIELNKEMFIENNSPEKKEAFYKKLHSGIASDQLESFKNILSRLFPVYATVMKKFFLDYNNDDDNRSKCRVSSPEWFRSYFSLSIPNENFSPKEIETIIELSKNVSSLRDKFRELIKKKSKDSLSYYTKFLIYFLGFPKENISSIENFLQAMFDVNDEETLYRNMPLHIVYKLLELIDKEKRVEILKNVFDTSESLSLLAQVAFSDLKDKGLQDIALKRIKDFSKNKNFMEIPSIAFIINQWKKFSEKEVHQYLSSLISTDDGILAFLKAFSSSGWSAGIGDIKTRKELSIREDLHEFLLENDYKKLIKGVEKILEENKIKDDLLKNAVKVFIENHDRLRV